MKYLIGIGIFIGGLSIGYVIGDYDSETISDDGEIKTEFITEMVHDTIVETKTIKVPVEEEIDSLMVNSDSTDILSDSLLVMDDSLDGVLSIKREKLIRTTWITITDLKVEEKKDTVVKELLGIEETKPSKLMVEFWESPLHFSGYKLSKSKLVMYGMPAQYECLLYRKPGQYFLSLQNNYYSLKETEEFLPYLEVEKEEVFND
jgi:hypothetical protein